ncbi:MAG: FtsQ-type POTRA domain-containing protein [Oscillospiraceae bacterium]|nr:FtsQ-type POTRA domain-containing protein [Oscillospiraceae bacterium]
MRKTGENENTYSSKTDRVNMSGQGRRQKKHRRDAYLVGGTFVIVIAVAIICFTFLFKLADIEVLNDAQRYSDGQIMAVSGLETGDSLMSVNKRAIASEIEEKLPYIGKAKVKIKYPDTAQILVEYTKASLALEEKDGYVLLDMSGKVLERGVKLLPDYIAVISGAVLSEALPGKTAVFTEENILPTLTRLANAFDVSGITGVTAYDLTDLSDIVAEVDYNTDIKLGSGSKAEEQLRFGKEVINRTLNQAKSVSSKLVIDLTQEGSAFVRTQSNIDASKQAAEEAITSGNATESAGEGTLPDEPSSENSSVTAENNTSSPDVQSELPSEAESPDKESEAVG